MTTADVNGSYAILRGYREHREMLAQIIKRSRFLLVAPAKTITRKDHGAGGSDVAMGLERKGVLRDLDPIA
jgi:hypothetical protein